jgi:hypothetical protein
MKNLLILLALTFTFACHTKEDQKNSGINDPINISYNDVDSSVLSSSGSVAEEAQVPVTKLDSHDTTQVAACIDSTKIQADAVCTMDYVPVCGCDGKEYSNKCQAEKSGVTKWVDGPCAKKPEQKTNKKKKH